MSCIRSQISMRTRPRTLTSASMAIHHASSMPTSTATSRVPLGGRLCLSSGKLEATMCLWPVFPHKTAFFPPTSMLESDEDEPSGK
ncbi:hypothetical protein CABS03_04909 [Colletotrichum abscissum]|uniref:Uncharacterized protein n=1 Tax=Colletotrichum abscissum TaxID=1671311 RepID=A0A9Q0AYC3_9PEZI|nr:hypothetical protein CABS02_13539 [Colletotrichum abscissum]